MREQTWEERTKRNRWTNRIISRSRSVSSMVATAEARLKRGRRGESMHQPYRSSGGDRRRQVLRFAADLQVDAWNHASIAGSQMSNPHSTLSPQATESLASKAALFPCQSSRNRDVVPRPLPI